MIYRAADPRAGEAWTFTGLSSDLELRRMEVSLAADRPDRLEVEFPFVPGTAFDDARPGQAIRVEVADGCLFDGVIDARALDIGPAAGGRGKGGATGSFVAYSRFERRRRASTEREVYYQSTDAEIAQRIADGLGLRAEVEPSSVVHERLVREGDPLLFLRARARALGFELAVTDDTLWFSTALRSPDSMGGERSSSEVARRLTRDDPILDLSFEEVDLSSDGSSSERVQLRGGEIRLIGDSSWRPLDIFELVGFGPADGAYRIVRTTHTRSADAEDGAGSGTTLYFLSEGVDWERFEHRGSRIASRRGGDVDEEPSR